MNDKMHDLVVMTAVAIYQTHGVVAAVTFLRTNGWSTNDAFALCEAWDDLERRVHKGEIGNYPGLSDKGNKLS